MTIHDCLHPSYLAVINTFSFCQLLIAVCMQTVCTCEHLWTLISVFCAQCLVLCVLALFVLDQQIFFLISSFPTIDIYILLGEIWHMFYMCTQPAFYHVNVRCNPGLHITHTPIHLQGKYYSDPVHFSAFFWRLPLHVYGDVTLV